MLSDIYKYMFQNRIGCVKVSVPASCVVWVRATIGSNQRLQKVSVPASCVVDSSNDRVKPKITTLLFAASPRSFNE